MKPGRLFLLMLVIIGFAAVQQAQASSVVKTGFDTMTNNADIIISGRVTSVDYNIIEKNDKQIPYTYVTVFISETLKGSVPGSYTFKLAGGPLPEKNLVYEIGEMPKFKVGQEVLLFLRNNENLYSPIVGLHQGRFNLITDKSTGVKKVYDNFGNPVSESFLTGKSSGKSGAPVSYDEFRSQLKSKLK